MVKKAGTKGANKVSFKKGAWTTEEDRKLAEFVKTHGDNKWKYLPVKAGLNRCGKSCRLRWLNYLRPGIKRGNISEEEEDLILRLHSLLGNRWSLIAGRLPGRTDNEIKNHWNTHLSKKALTISQLNQKLSKMVEPISSETSDKIGMVESNCGNNSASPLAYSIPLSSNDQIATNVLPMSNEHNNYHDCFISSRSTWDELPNVDFDLEGFFDLPSSPCFSESIQITELGFLEEKSQSEVIDRHSDSIQEVGCKMMANLLDYEADAAFISFFGTHA